MAIHAVSFGLALLVSACAPVPAPVTASQPQPPADPVLAFVSGATVGQSGVVNDPAGGGSETVVVNTEYNAASGEICKTYGTTGSTGQVRHLACGIGAGWHNVPPLTISSN
jgi:hypothetical protein